MITYLEEADIVVVTTSGEYDLRREVDTVRKAVAFMNDRNCERCLFDHRQARVVADTMSAYDRPALYDALEVKASVRAASVFKIVNEDVRFLENVCRNRGWNFRAFDDYDAALQWLA